MLHNRAVTVSPAAALRRNLGLFFTVSLVSNRLQQHYGVPSYTSSLVKLSPIHPSWWNAIAAFCDVL